MWLVLSAEKKALAQGVVGSDVVSHWLKKVAGSFKANPSSHDYFGHQIL